MSDHAKPESKPTAAAPGWAGRILRPLTGGIAAARRHWLRATAIALACAGSIAGLVLGWSAMMRSESPEPAVTLEMTLDALDRGDLVRAQALAKQLQREGALPPEKLGGPAFVLGAAAAREAREMLSRDATERYLVASRYLEEARTRGLPEGREPEAFYLLGRSLFYSNQPVAARGALQEALKLCPDDVGEIRCLLAATYLNESVANPAAALAENEALLKLRTLSTELRNDGLLQRADILVRLGRATEARATLDALPHAAQSMAETIVLRGRLLIDEARQLAAQGEEKQPEARAKFEEALQTLRKVEGRDTLRSQATGKAMYLMGVCLQGIGDSSGALAQFERTVKAHPRTPEGQAAGFREAEQLAAADKEKESLAALRRVLLSVVSAETYDNPWLPLEDLRATTLETYQRLIAQRKYEMAAKLAQAVAGVFSEARAAELTAETHQSWAISLAAAAEGEHTGQAASLREQARAQYREAGQCFNRLARLQSISRQYSEYLWNAASCYQLGQDYQKAVVALREYLKNETRNRHAQALVILGESLLAIDRIDDAQRAFQECIEFHPRDVVAYRARYLAAQAWAEKGDMARAEELLAENLGGEYLTPASKEWRDSLFALGEILHAEKRYAEAIVRLDEAVKRYGDTPPAIQGRYLLADAYRQLAQSAQDRLRQSYAGREDLSLTPAIQEEYRRALDGFRALQELLIRRQEKEELLPLDQELLKNCGFAIGGIYMDLERYDLAIKSYTAVATRYPNCPEALDGYLQIARAYRRIGKMSEARSTIEQAKVVLGRMKPEHDFQETTNYTREQWSELLDRLSQS